MSFVDLLPHENWEIATPLDDLPHSQVLQLQRGLAMSFIECGPADGLMGQKTRAGYHELLDQLDEALEYNALDVLGCECLDAQRADLQSVLATPAEAVRLRIVDLCFLAGLSNAQAAYVLATTEHETANTWAPVREAYWLDDAEKWRRENLRYFPYYGRGYVQLTWQSNYARYAQLTGLDLVRQPDLALRDDVALFALVHGLVTGTFTGHRLDRYVNADQTDYVNARRVVNGLDRAEHIAALARSHYRALGAEPDEAPEAPESPEGYVLVPPDAAIYATVEHAYAHVSSAGIWQVARLTSRREYELLAVDPNDDSDLLPHF